MISNSGLNSVLFARITVWQQVILFILMCMGSLPSVSLVTILIRRHFFRLKFLHMVQTDRGARKRVNDVEARQEAKEGRKLHKLLHPKRLFEDGEFAYEDSSAPQATMRSTMPSAAEVAAKKKQDKKKAGSHRFTKDMIHRVDDQDKVQRIMSHLADEKAAEELASRPRTTSAPLRDVAEKEDPDLALADDESEHSGEKQAASSSSGGKQSVESVGDKQECAHYPVSHFSADLLVSVRALSDNEEDMSPRFASVGQRPRMRRASENIPRPLALHDREFKQTRTMG